MKRSRNSKSIQNEKNPYWPFHSRQEEDNFIIWMAMQDEERRKKQMNSQNSRTVLKTTETVRPAQSETSDEINSTRATAPSPANLTEKDPNRKKTPKEKWIDFQGAFFGFVITLLFLYFVFELCRLVFLFFTA